MSKEQGNNKKSRDESATDSQDESDVENRPKLGQSSGPFLKKIKIKGYDTTDALPKDLNFSLLDIFVSIYSICTFLIDVALDVLLAYIYYHEGHKWYFTLTVIFIAVPSLAMTGFSLRWYLIDADTKDLPKVSPRRWTLRVVFLVLQLGPILRYVDALYFGIKSNRNKKSPVKQVKYYKLMIYEDADATLLRLFECFLESGPQLILQLSIYAQTQALEPNGHGWTEYLQIFSMVTSLISIAWALTSYQRALRYSQQNKLELTNWGMVVQFIWRFFDIFSRVLALGLLASMFPRYFFIVCAVHYAIMFLWIRIMKTNFCDDKCGEFVYNMILGVIFLFCYFNPKDSPTRRRFTFYYVVVFLENSAMMSVWFNYLSPHVPYKLPAMFMQFLSFFIGLVIMIIYYLLFHPTKNISLWDHWVKSKTTELPMQNGSATKEVAQVNEIQENKV